MIGEAAIASFLSPDDAERREAIIAKRLDRLDRRMDRLERDVGIAVESLAVFIRFWVNTTPALPEPAAKAAKAKSAERYEAFITALGRRLAQGPKLRQETEPPADFDEAAWQAEWDAGDTDGDGKLSREEAKAGNPNMTDEV
eukprot:jgi/Tetstr1/451713/TSEL_038749.t1